MFIVFNIGKERKSIQSSIKNNVLEENINNFSKICLRMTRTCVLCSKISAWNNLKVIIIE